MRKRMGLLVLTFALLCPQTVVKAVEKNHSQTIEKYVDFFLDEVKGTNSEESVVDLKDSLETLLEKLKPEDARKIIKFIKEKIDNGAWESEKGITDAIAEGEKKFNVTLTKDQKDKIILVITKIKELGISPEYFVEQMEKIYQKYGDEIKESIGKETDKVMEKTQKKVKQEVNKAVTDYFSDMVYNVKSFVKGIFRK